MHIRLAEIIQARRMERQATGGLVIGWLFAAGSWVTSIHVILPLVATAMSIVGTIYAMRASRRTEKLKEIEIQKAQIDIIKAQIELCELCRSEHINLQCKFPPEQRPDNCPQKHQKPN